MTIFHLILLFYISSSSCWLFPDENDYFSDFSNKMKVNLTGCMVAFGDFNADRATDVFVLNNIDGVQQLDVILMINDLESPFKRISLFKDSDIAGVMVGDFNGDSILDIIIYRIEIKFYKLLVAYGMTNRIGVKSPIALSDDVMCTTPPLHLDWNADMIGDIFCHNMDNNFVVMLGGKNGVFLRHTVNVSKFYKTDKLMYSKFVDINKDGQADILLIGQDNKGCIFMISLEKKDGQFFVKQRHTSDIKAVRIGQPVVRDFNFSDKLSMIVPMCRNENCANSFLVVCSLTSYTCVENNAYFLLDGHRMRFVHKSEMEKLSLAVPELMPMSCGDLKLSGTIDCLVIMTKVVGPFLPTVIIFTNNGKGVFSLRTVAGNAALFTNVTQVAIFDLEENGIPDIITTKSFGQSSLIVPLWHNSPNDQYFIKVMVLNGLCSGYGNCPNHILPYGIPLPGVSVSYSTEAIDGSTQASTLSMCTDSSYTSLQLPYAHFGLGSFANYVDKLYISLPYNITPRKHTLSFIVPKTQIVIIPFPLDEPSKWTNRLFLDPFGNRSVIYVAAALSSLFLGVTAVVYVLHYLEARDDRSEKLEESYKFHFDAL